MYTSTPASLSETLLVGIVISPFMNTGIGPHAQSAPEYLDVAHGRLEVLVVASHGLVGNVEVACNPSQGGRLEGSSASVVLDQICLVKDGRCRVHLHDPQYNIVTCFRKVSRLEGFLNVIGMSNEGRGTAWKAREWLLQPQVGGEDRGKDIVNSYATSITVYSRDIETSEYGRQF